ncbi:hypothetical protein [Aestuariivita sp.]|uniref:hypothetical protein n=1 Tax=Aestuariivita sp. TaxID=1872407 RepID=UPI00216E5FBE|nr:hypothetical protein [Aestuariivita sp.]MCE8008002.1 hypothetical protein [Aestuariivita sp.]
MKPRPLLCAVLAFCLVITGQVVAQAKAAAPATGQMVLCVGAGSIVVFTDAEGKPTSAPHLCPDCTLGALPGPAGADRVSRSRDRSGQRLRWPVVALGQPVSCGALLSARDPPAGI